MDPNLPSPAKDRSDPLAAIFFMVVGIAAIVVSGNYTMGTAAQMGAGYFPRLIGILLVALSALHLTLSLRRPAKPLQEEWGSPLPLVFVTGSIVLFAFLVEPGGLVIAIPALVLLASRSDANRRWKELLIVTIVLTAATSLVFVEGFGVSLPIFPDAF